MAHQLGGEVEGGHHREFGRAEVLVTEDTPLFEGVWKKGEKYPVWMSHGDRVTKLPNGFRVVGTSANAPIAMIADEKRKFYATQFHLEVMHTPHGAAAASQFRPQDCRRRGDWTMRAFKDEAVEKIRKQVGKGRVICGLSGGVDSAVAAVLIHEAIGDQLTCVFVDHGLLATRTKGKDRGRPVPRPLQHSAGSCRCVSAIPRRAKRHLRPGGKAQDHWQAVHRRVRGRGEKDRRCGIPGAGHALSRRDRERVVHRRAVGHHQVAPQRRRACRSA